LALLECSLPFGLPSCRRRSTSPGSWSLQRHGFGLAPCEVGCPDPPRFRSQAFSTSQRFPSKLEPRGLVSCHSRPWDPPFRAFPSRGSRAPLEVACSLAVIHRCAEARRSSPFTAGFPDVHAFTQLPGSPDDYGLPFGELESSPPGRPGLGLTDSPRSASFTCFEAFLPS